MRHPDYEDYRNQLLQTVEGVDFIAIKRLARNESNRSQDVQAGWFDLREQPGNTGLRRAD